MSVDSQHVGKFAATQSLAEIALGSLLHSLHIPLSGHFLSLNQGFLLTLGIRPLATRREGVEFSSSMALVVALLKSLSPAGKKLLPMLAISMQGLLYSLGIAILGVNYFGALLGIMLLSLWAFVQPLLVTYLLLGKSFFFAVEKVWTDIAASLNLPEHSGIWILSSLVCLKILLAAIVAGVTWKKIGNLDSKYLEKLSALKVNVPSPTQKSNLAPWCGALRDLLNPFFVFSLIFTLLFFFLSQQKSHFELIFYALRTLAIAVVFFWVVRAIPVSWYLRLAKRFPVVAATLDQVFRDKSRT